MTDETPLNKLLSFQTGIARIRSADGSEDRQVCLEIGYETIQMISRSRHPDHADHPFLVYVNPDLAEELSKEIQEHVAAIRRDDSS